MRPISLLLSLVIVVRHHHRGWSPHSTSHRRPKSPILIMLLPMRPNSEVRRTLEAQSGERRGQVKGRWQGRGPEIESQTTPEIVSICVARRA
jgi:hypothetical protein